MAEPDKAVFEIKLEDFFTKVLTMIGKVTDQQIADALKQAKKTISTAESITGGLVAARLTNVAGSSQYFHGGVVAYHARTKVMNVGVPANLISKHGAVSKEVALAMAENIRKKLGTDLGLAATGAAGPKPEPPAPVGRIYIALSDGEKSEYKELNLQGPRNEIREKTAQAALGLLWLYLGGRDVM